VCIALHGNPSQNYGASLLYGMTLPPDTGELNPNQAGRYSIYLPERDGRLSSQCVQSRGRRSQLSNRHKLATSD